MSETQQRETELVVGTIGGITQKKADTWTIQVTTEGARYPKNLWTQDANLVESLQTKLGQMGAFVGALGAPYMVNGKEIRSWWIHSLQATNAPDGDDGATVTGDGSGHALPPIREGYSAPRTDTAAARVNPVGAMNEAMGGSSKGNEMSKEEWARKDSAIHKMACIKTAADALKHTLPSDPSSDDISRFLSRVSILSTAWHDTVIAQRDDPTGESVPF